MKIEESFINYSVDDVKKNIIERDGWGAYFVIEDFLDKSLFERLCADYNFWKKRDKKIWTGEENPRVWRFTEDKGINLTIGGSGTDISYFRRLSNLSKVWGDFIKIMYSKDVFTMKELPESITIIGGGAIGVEFAYFFNSFTCCFFNKFYYFT